MQILWVFLKKRGGLAKYLKSYHSQINLNDNFGKQTYHRDKKCDTLSIATILYNIFIECTYKLL